MGAYVSLLEYNGIEGMILLSELSRRRIRSITKLIKVRHPAHPARMDYSTPRGLVIGSCFCGVLQIEVMQHAASDEPSDEGTARCGSRMRTQSWCVSMISHGVC